MRKTNDKRRTNKSRLVLEHLKEYGSITSWEAIEKYGTTRLSAIIYNIRKHHIVQSVDSSFTDRYGNESTFTKYVYCGEI